MSEFSLESIDDPQAVLARLAAQGLSPPAAKEKARLFAKAAKGLQKAGHPVTASAMALFVPGRIEVLGKHTDYAGGRSMLVAVEKGFCVVAVPRADASIRMLDVRDGERVAFELKADLLPTPGHWSNYPMTVARRVARNFPGGLRGTDVAFASDLPRDAGMSSSSAMIVATFLAISAVNNLPGRDEYQSNIHCPEDLAGYLGTVENGLSFGTLQGDRGVGTFGGSEDHTAMLCARKDQIVQYAYCPVRFERTVTLPEDHVFVVAVSGVVADKTGSAMDKYNRVSKLAAAAVEVWRRASRRDDPHLAAALASAPNAPDRIREAIRRRKHAEFTPDELLRRFEQFMAESEQIIPAVGNSLVGVPLERFGELVERSQALGAELLGNQTPETIWLAERARALGAVASSAFGAGFGGSVWALVRQSAADRLQRRWAAQYKDAFPEPANRSSFFVTRAGPAAFRLARPAD